MNRITMSLVSGFLAVDNDLAAQPTNVPPDIVCTNLHPGVSYPYALT